MANQLINRNTAVNKIPNHESFLGEIDKLLSKNDLFSMDWLDKFEPLQFKDKSNGFPPYNIIKGDSDGEYHIEVALAGFSKDDIEVLLENNMLLIQHEKVESTPESESDQYREKDDIQDGRNYIHRGIAKRSFNLRFRLPQYAEVESCEMNDGILSVHVKVDIPEEKRPKVIEIK